MQKAERYLVLESDGTLLWGGIDMGNGCSCAGEVEVDISWKVKSKTKISVNGPAITENTKKKEQNSPKEYDK